VRKSKVLHSCRPTALNPSVPKTFTESCRSTAMYDYDVHEAVYLGPGVGPLLPNSENVLNLLLYCQRYMRKSICMIMMFIKMWQDLSTGTFIFALITLTLEFDLLLKKINIGHISWIVSDRAFIFHLRISCDKTSVLVPSFLTLWPWSLTYS
jgi:hypothetical protein